MQGVLSQGWPGESEPHTPDWMGRGEPGGLQQIDGKSHMCLLPQRGSALPVFGSESGTVLQFGRVEPDFSQTFDYF